jgi:hypothetical protein
VCTVQRNGEKTPRFKNIYIHLHELAGLGYFLWPCLDGQKVPKIFA